VYISGNFTEFIEWENFSDNHCRKNQNRHFMFNFYSWKSCHLWDNVEKYGRAR